MHRLLFGVSGASGMLLAQTVLACFAELRDLEIHLIISEGARLAIKKETGKDAEILERYAAFVHAPDDMAAPMASGSWRHEGMFICPCSMSSLAAIANGTGRNLIHRAADVALKERFPLVLSPRETPLSKIHLRNMKLAADAGAVIMPFMPAFYVQSASLSSLMRNFAGRVLDQFGIPSNLCQRWAQ